MRKLIALIACLSSFSVFAVERPSVLCDVILTKPFTQTKVKLEKQDILGEANYFKSKNFVINEVQMNLAALIMPRDNTGGIQKVITLETVKNLGSENEVTGVHRAGTKGTGEIQNLYIQAHEDLLREGLLSAVCEF